MSSDSSSSASASASSPLVLRDPRFAAGRKLIQEGLAQDAIELYSTLVEECIAKYGETSIETAPAFYEYGNALLRASIMMKSNEGEEQEDDDDDDDEVGVKEAARTAAGEAALARATAAGHVKNETDDQHEAEEVVSSTNDKELEETVGDDLPLSLEMMENAYSILDEYQTHTQSTAYLEWTKDQLPRILLGIGDCLSALQRHADAADAYSRAQQLRQTQLDAIIAMKEDTIEHLQCQRRVCEATVLIAEELLACPDGQDVVTTETQSLIVEADQRIEYSRGYYDKARDSLQDTVYLMGKLAAKKVDLGTEKEDVCYLATMIMGVGEQLAALDEEIAEQKAAASTEPAKKKAKT